MTCRLAHSIAAFLRELALCGRAKSGHVIRRIAIAHRHVCRVFAQRTSCGSHVVKFSRTRHKPLKRAHQALIPERTYKPADPIMKRWTGLCQQLALGGHLIQ